MWGAHYQKINHGAHKLKYIRRNRFSMSNIEYANLSSKKILHHIEEFERYCMGKTRLTPARFRSLNEELSIGAVLTIGKHRFVRNGKVKHLIWSGLDGEEYDLGAANRTNVLRDFPGFHARRTLALGENLVKENTVIQVAGMRGNLSVVTMEDGSIGIGPNYRMALRNASLKMHLKSKFNRVSLTSLWGMVWGNA